MDGQGTFLILLIAYFAPAIVASYRRHRNRMAITVLNIFLGWTLLGWIAALVWASTADIEQPGSNSLDNFVTAARARLRGADK